MVTLMNLLLQVWRRVSATSGSGSVQLYHCVQKEARKPKIKICQHRQQYRGDLVICGAVRALIWQAARSISRRCVVKFSEVTGAPCGKNMSVHTAFSCGFVVASATAISTAIVDCCSICYMVWTNASTSAA